MALQPDSVGSDVSRVNNAARKAVSTAQNAAKDAKTVAGAAGKAAAGNYLGAAVDIIKNPRIIIAGLVIAAIIILIPIVGFCTFVLDLPGTLIESTMAAGTNVENDLTLGWEDWKATLGNGIDDFLTFLKTGQSGTEQQTYETQVAAARDPDFSSIAGTANAFVAVLNNYFRKGYENKVPQAEAKANEELDSLIQQAHSDGVSDEHLTTSVTFDGTELDYMDWTFYIISGDSISRIHNDDAMFDTDNPAELRSEIDNKEFERVAFRAKYLIEEAQTISSTKNLWRIGVTSSIVNSTAYEYDYELDEDGHIVYTPEGIPIITETREVPARSIQVTYRLEQSADAKQQILDYYNISTSTVDDVYYTQKDGTEVRDVSDMGIWEKNVERLKAMYSTILADMEATGTVKEWITGFYADHADLVFDGPSTVAGPVPGWKQHITSHMGSQDCAEHATGHGGTDIGVADKTAVYAPSRGVVVQVVTGYPDERNDSAAGGRGNFIFVYYGEQNGVSGKGIFVLYQHMADVVVSEGSIVDAGTLIAHSGTSGKSTGPHIHVESYVGTTKLDAEYFLS